MASRKSWGLELDLIHSSNSLFHEWLFEKLLTNSIQLFFSNKLLGADLQNRLLLNVIHFYPNCFMC